MLWLIAISSDCVYDDGGYDYDYYGYDYDEIGIDDYDVEEHRMNMIEVVAVGALFLFRLVFVDVMGVLNVQCCCYLSRLVLFYLVLFWLFMYKLRFIFGVMIFLGDYYKRNMLQSKLFTFHPFKFKFSLFSMVKWSKISTMLR